MLFKVKVNSIHFKELPELDDEFAKDSSETAETLEQYKAEIRERLTKSAQDRSDAAFENEIIEAVVENAKIDIPDAMIEDQLDGIMRELSMQMAYSGMRMEDFYKYTNQTEEQVRATYRDQAKERVGSRLVLDAIAKKEGIEATDEDIDAEIERYAQQSGMEADKVRQSFGENLKDTFEHPAVISKTVKFLKENAK